MSQSNDPMIAALLREREGYVRFGKPDRIKAVDAELKRRGHKAEKDPKATPPKERTAPRKRTTKAPAKKATAAPTPQATAKASEPEKSKD